MGKQVLPLRAWLAWKKISHKELAEIVDVSPRSVSKWATEGLIPLPKHQRRIAEALGVELEQIDFKNQKDRGLNYGKENK